MLFERSEIGVTFYLSFYDFVQGCAQANTRWLVRWRIGCRT